MSDIEHDDVDFGYHDNAAADRPAAAPRSHRAKTRRAKTRSQGVGQLVGLVALVAGGVYVVSQAVHDRSYVATQSGALTSLAPPSQSTNASASASVASAASASASASTRGRELDLARAGAKPGETRPSVSPTATEIADVHTTETGSLRGTGRTLRVESARGDLTGQRELGWVAGGEHAYGDATCSQTVRYRLGDTPMLRPSMLICWRTSPTRSVITVMIDAHGQPSSAASVAALDSRWQQLG